jgi:uncharacterized protein (TIGR03437 family)
MFRISANKISLAASALLLCAAFAQAGTVPGSPITAAPASVSITFALPSTPGSMVPVVLTVPTADVSDPFVVDPTTVPSWLSVLNAAGNATDLSDTAVPSPGLTINFQASTAASVLGVGAHVADVHFKVNGFQDLVVPVNLTVTSATPATLSVLNGSTPVANNGTVPITWVYGSSVVSGVTVPTAAPSVTLTLLSSDYPISFTAASAVSGGSPEDWILLSAPSGIAYNYGTSLTITFSPDALLNAKVSATPMAGTVTISYASTTYVINIALTVGEPNPTITNIFPQETPVVASGALTVVVTGTGFGTVAQGFTTATTVKIAYGAVAATLLTGITAHGGGPTGTVSIVDPTTMILTIPWQDATPASILDTAGQNVTISVTNAGTTVTAVLYVTANPVIYSITDAAALTEPAPGSQPNVAPYELITIFGSNFCPTCSVPVVAPVVSSRYATTLTAPVGGSGHPLTVTFYKSDGVTLVGDAYILFATNTQINALVPSVVLAADNPMQVVVSYNGVLSNTNVLYEANAVVANPGIFTTTSNGQGQGAILLSDYSVNSATNPAVAADKVAGTALIYVSGMGAPTSTSASVTSTKAGTFPTSCISMANYVSAAALTPATMDGVVLSNTNWGTGNLPPCFAAKGYAVVTIGGVAATVTYAGWVQGSVAGLYQINVTIPKATTSVTPVAVPVTVTVDGVPAQTGATMYVATKTL